MGREGDKACQLSAPLCVFGLGPNAKSSAFRMIELERVGLSNKVAHQNFA